MTLPDLASALKARRASATGKESTSSNNIPDSQIVSLYTRCGRCGKSLFMDDSLIVEQSSSVEKFLERCAKRLFEHRCDSGSSPHV
jgi:hypothetical protein